MKKLLLTAALISGICVPCLAQIDFFVGYEPVIIGENGGYRGSSNSSNSSFSDLFVDYNPVDLFGYKTSRRQRPQQKETQNFTRLTGYYIVKNSFVRVSIQVNAVTEMGREQLYLRGVYDDSRGWRKVNKRATKVGYNSPDYIKENFNWEVYDSSYGTIYLSY